MTLAITARPGDDYDHQRAKLGSVLLFLPFDLGRLLQV